MQTVSTRYIVLIEVMNLSQRHIILSQTDIMGAQKANGREWYRIMAGF